MKTGTRRDFLKSLGCGFAAASLAGCASTTAGTPSRPNIIYILADDLGYNELGCYGQKKIRTPHLDRLAAEGIRFTRHYSGSAVCAPTRCMLLTGKHSGHAYIRGNDEMGDRGDVWNDPELEGQRPLPADTETVGRMLQRAGYQTACVGKWGLGWYGSTGDPNQQGFDHFFGYICQREAHNYYPTHLWKDGKKFPLNNTRFKAHQKFPKEKDPIDPMAYEPYRGHDYAPDFMLADILEFLKKHQKQPFFLYWCTPVPHVSLQVPENSLKEYEGAFPETPYLGEKGYLPHPAPRAAYAAMITRMDRDIGIMLEELKRLGMARNTLILFSSDNGPTFNGGTDSSFFESNKPFSGLKCSLREGGIRVPMIARWPGHIPANTTTGHLSAQWDFLATVADLLGEKALGHTDGLSFLPTLLGRDGQEKHEYLYWEYAGQQAVRIDDFKGYRRNAKKAPREPIRLFNLRQDPGESRDLADRYPDMVAKMKKIMNSRTPSRIEKWNFPRAGS